MIKHTLEISREPAHLAVRLNQLLIQRHGETVAQTACEDLGVIVVDNPQVTYTHNALDKIAQSDAMLVICGADHLPSAMLLPLAAHSTVVWRLRDQIAAKRALNKQLWRQLIVEKIRNQASCLPDQSNARQKLISMAKLVRSGDPTNVEARAAKVYWKHYLSDNSFTRNSNGFGLNGLLNYGYAILRAAIARAIVAAGLLPSLGIHHCNRANIFCLADDLIEPLRTVIDVRARELYAQGSEELEQATKASILEVLSQPMQLNEETGPMMVMLHRYVASLVKCYEGQSRKLEIPRTCS